MVCFSLNNHYLSSLFLYLVSMASYSLQILSFELEFYTGPLVLIISNMATTT